MLMRQLFPISWMEAIWSDAEITADYRNVDFETRFLVGWFTCLLYSQQVCLAETDVLALAGST